MQYIKREISKERFYELSKLPHYDFQNKVESTIPDEWQYGYGWFGASLIEEDGKFYIEHKIGNSCE